MFDKVRLLLRQYAALSGGRFTYRIYNPEPLDEIEDRAIAAGLQPLPVADLNVNAFFGLTLTDSVDNRQTIPFFALERQNFLEQDITQKIFELAHPRKNLASLPRCRSSTPSSTTTSSVRNGRLSNSSKSFTE